jgi:hypothetical protein
MVNGKMVNAREFPLMVFALGAGGRAAAIHHSPFTIHR